MNVHSATKFYFELFCNFFIVLSPIFQPLKTKCKWRILMNDLYRNEDMPWLSGIRTHGCPMKVRDTTTWTLWILTLDSVQKVKVDIVTVLFSDSRFTNMQSIPFRWQYKWIIILKNVAQEMDVSGNHMKDSYHYKNYNHSFFISCEIQLLKIIFYGTKQSFLL